MPVGLHVKHQLQKQPHMGTGRNSPTPFCLVLLALATANCWPVLFYVVWDGSVENSNALPCLLLIEVKVSWWFKVQFQKGSSTKRLKHPKSESYQKIFMESPTKTYHIFFSPLSSETYISIWNDSLKKREKRKKTNIFLMTNNLDVMKQMEKATYIYRTVKNEA